MNITTIITTFNRPQEIKLAIESVCDQTKRTAELIVIFDKSKYQFEYDINFILSKMRFFKYGISIISLTQKMGVSAARNLGMDLAKCEWCMFLDDDDIWDKRKLETQVNIIQNNSNVDIVGGHKTKNFSPKTYIQAIPPHSLYFKSYASPSTMFLKTSCNVRFSNQNYMEDQYFIMCALLENYNFVYQKHTGVIEQSHKAIKQQKKMSRQIIKMSYYELKNIFRYNDLQSNSSVVFFSAIIYSILKIPVRWIRSNL